MIKGPWEEFDGGKCLKRTKDCHHSQMCLLHPNPRNHCFEDALHHLATLRALLQRLEPAGLTVPSMSHCLSLSPFLMFLSKMHRPPSWYETDPKVTSEGLGGKRDFFHVVRPGVSQGKMGRILVKGGAKLGEGGCYRAVRSAHDRLF